MSCSYALLIFWLGPGLHFIKAQSNLCSILYLAQVEPVLKLLTHVGFFRQNFLIVSEVFFYIERSKNLEKMTTVQKSSPSWGGGGG